MFRPGAAFGFKKMVSSRYCSFKRCGFKWFKHGFDGVLPVAHSSTIYDAFISESLRCFNVRTIVHSF
jgi:hypothetical protein